MKKLKFLIASFLALFESDSYAMGQKAVQDDIKYQINGKHVGEAEFEDLKEQLNISEDCKSSDSVHEDGSFNGWEMNCPATHKTSKIAYSYSEYGVAGVSYVTHKIAQVK